MDRRGDDLAAVCRGGIRFYDLPVIQQRVLPHRVHRGDRIDVLRDVAVIQLGLRRIINVKVFFGSGSDLGQSKAFGTDRFDLQLLRRRAVAHFAGNNAVQVFANADVVDDAKLAAVAVENEIAEICPQCILSCVHQRQIRFVFIRFKAHNAHGICACGEHAFPGMRYGDRPVIDRSGQGSVRKFRVADRIGSLHGDVHLCGAFRAEQNTNGCRSCFLRFGMPQHRKRGEHQQSQRQRDPFSHQRTLLSVNLPHLYHISIRLERPCVVFCEKYHNFAANADSVCQNPEKRRCLQFLSEPAHDRFSSVPAVDGRADNAARIPCALADRIQIGTGNRLPIRSAQDPQRRRRAAFHRR